MLHSGGTNFPVALNWQNRVSAKLKIENPSFDTSIRRDKLSCGTRQAWFNFKLENNDVYLYYQVIAMHFVQFQDLVPKVMVTNEGIKNVPAKTLKAGVRPTEQSASLERNLDAKALMLAINQSPIVFTRGWCGMEWATQPCGGESGREPS
ncbi:hypothetical protein Tco_0307653 [Tanacetum coccineum]